MANKSNRRNPLPPQRGARVDLDAVSSTSATSGPHIEDESYGQPYTGAYTDVPPASRRTEQDIPFSMDRLATLLAIVGACIAVIIYAVRVDSNIDVVKTDVREVKTKVDGLESKSVQQASILQQVDNTLRRVEGEQSKTLESIRQGNRKKQ